MPQSISTNTALSPSDYTFYYLHSVQWSLSDDNI